MKKVELSWFERQLAQVAPALALKRAGSRMMLDQFTEPKKRGYDAGRKSRSQEGWRMQMGTSANSEVKIDIDFLVARSRDLVRNNPYAKKAVQVITTNVVGTGVRPSIPKKALNKGQEKKLMELWRSWGETTTCDFNEQFNFYGLLMQAWRAVIESGNIFIRRVWDPDAGVVPLRLQLLEFDYLDRGRDGQILDNGNFVIAGIEFIGSGPKKGRRVAYWMFDKHPGDNMPIAGDLLSKRIPAADIIHMYEVLRPGQVIGIPRGVAAFLRLKDLDNYEDAQLKRQVIAACFSVFVRKTGEGGIGDDEETDSSLSDVLSPGRIEYLDPGEDIQFASPPGTNGYEPYMRNLIRSIASAFLVTYESISGDLSNVNFSSYRAGWLEFHRQVGQDQEFIVKGMGCQPVWKWFMTAARLGNGYNGPDMMANWTPPRREMIDPVKEVKGMVDMVRGGLGSKADAVRQLGNDPEELYEEIKAERAEADKDGLMFESDSKNDAARVNFGKDAYLASKTKVPVKK